MSDEALDPELNALEAGLQALAPRAPAINRDRLLFLAGRASAKRRAAGWRALAVGSTLAAAGLGLVLCFRPPSRVEVEVVHWLPAPPEQPTLPNESPGSYGADARSASPHFDGRNEPYGQMQMRRLALDYGVDALPRVSGSESESNSPNTVDEPPSAGSRIWWQLAHP